MNKEFIKKQLKLSKRQNKDERYDYLCSEFNAINYCANLEKYTNKLQQENKKYKEVINKTIEKINDYKIYCKENKGFTEYTDIEIEAIEPVISRLEDILKEGKNE